MIFEDPTGWVHGYYKTAISASSLENNPISTLLSLNNNNWVKPSIRYEKGSVCCCWSEYLLETEVTIDALKNGVATTEICADAFKNNTFLIDIYLPSSITKIGDNSFYSCTSLKRIHFDGTMEDWNAVELGASWCGYTSGVAVVCIDGTINL